MGLTFDQMDEAAQALSGIRDKAISIASEKFEGHKLPVRGAVVCAVADASSVIFLWLNDVSESQLIAAFDSLAKFVSKDLQELSREVLERAVEEAKDDVREKDKDEKSKNKIIEYLDKLKEIFSTPNRHS